MRPYNLYVSPILPLKFGVDRRFLFQSSAASFLQRHRFDFSKWLAGVPYLNSDEQRDIDKRQQRFVLQQFEDINVDQSGQQLLDSILPSLEAWANESNPEASWFNIAVSNSYQKRIVHQMLRQSYPRLYGLGRHNFIQIRRKSNNNSAEDAKRVEKYNNLMSDANEYAGVRHIFDHISRAKVPIVGHNVFVDLINIYAKFLGSLPTSVEEFAHQVNLLFPTVIDTKYFGTMSDVDETNAQHSSMKELLDKLRSVVYPVYSIHPEFTKYDNSEYWHEAGWDACETAKLFLKQGGKFFYLDVERAPPTPYSSSESEKGEEEIGIDVDIDLTTDCHGDATRFRRRRLRSSESESAVTDDISMSFSRPRRERGVQSVEYTLQADELDWEVPGSDHLGDAEDQWIADPSASDDAWDNFQAEQVPYSRSVHDVDQMMADAVEPLPPLLSAGAGRPILPPLSSSVWDPIVNHLRVMGTNERVLILK
ncbi:ribonuclease H-like domain-containing protein [Lipomyces orientalis]|uniref:Ribonuclease H-like domain-containing protein n=1 Tax=Lipomyces orientalis TaxID=1233043 RepID=A0ACC3TRI2_9ASCO